MSKDERYDDHADVLALLAGHTEVIGILQDELKSVRKTAHDTNNLMFRNDAALVAVSKTLDDIAHRLEKHMDGEEVIIKAIYGRLKSLDNELKDSFKERDDKINSIEKTQVKFGVFVACGVFVLSTSVQVAMRVLT